MVMTGGIKMKMTLNEEATSPVLGNLLMVAVVCILAAVIAVFVLSMPEEVESKPTIGVAVSQVGDNQIKTTFIGGADAGEILAINATSYVGGIENDTGGIANPNVGDYFLINGGTTGSDRVIVVTTFADGKQQVVYDGTV